MATKASAFQYLDNGVYRVGGARVNPMNGQYILRGTAPATESTRVTRSKPASKSSGKGAAKKSGK